MRSAGFSTPIYSKETAIKGLVIAATKSSSGKTTLTLGLMAALVRRGLKVAPFKVGPDFIDPGHHTTVTGTPSCNLDGWMIARESNQASFAHRSAGCDIAVVEGVMGLYDGYDGRSEAGSTAQMAKWLGLPVLLVVDAGSMARSAAALVQGFERFDPEVNFAGVVFNKLGSDRHLTYLREAVADHVEMPCLGGVLRNADIHMPERHLGLVTREDNPLSPENLDRLARLVESSIDIDDLLNRIDIGGITVAAQGGRKNQPPVQARIGIARDRAFCFYYQDNFDLLESYGAELVFFSPLSDSDLPDDLDGLYFGGGYPELAAQRLSQNKSLRKRILDESTAGMPIYGECGGFMYLCRELGDTEGKRYPMVGCFPFRTRMNAKLRSLGYRQVTMTQPTVIGPAGMTARGHEFHYSAIDTGFEAQSPAQVYRVAARAGGQPPVTGYQVDRTLGSYIHLHFGSQPETAREFVKSCAMYRQERIKSR